MKRENEADEESEWSKDREFLRLWDVYNPLLTASRKEITDLYFNYDLSLGEIAEEKGVSRQSVSDCLKKSRALLEEYEKKLGFAEASERYSGTVETLKRNVRLWVREQNAEHPERREELRKLLRLIGDDVSKE